MKRYTQAEFDAFEIDENGYRICPTGDYSEIKNFGKRCSFGERCSFGKRCSFGECCSFGERCSFGGHCSFGEWCSFGECCSFGKRCSFGECCKVEQDKELKELHFITPIGSRRDTLWVFMLTDGRIYTRAGCFAGYLEELEDKVRQEHGDNRYGREYMAAITYIKTIAKEQGNEKTEA